MELTVLHSAFNFRCDYVGTLSLVGTFQKQITNQNKLDEFVKELNDSPETVINIHYVNRCEETNLYDEAKELAEHLFEMENVKRDELSIVYIDTNHVRESYRFYNYGRSNPRPQIPKHTPESYDPEDFSDLMI